MWQKTGCTLILLFINLAVFSQEEKAVDEQQKGAHRITIGLGHTQQAKGENAEGKTGWLPLASWSLNYDYRVANKWAIGLQTDLVLEKFIVEDEDGEKLEREKPLAIIPVGIFKPGRHWGFMAGAGIELEKEKNLGLTRLGIEYGLEIPKGWEAGFAAMWDNKWGYYNSWVFEFSFSKIFFKKKRANEKGNPSN